MTNKNKRMHFKAKILKQLAYKQIIQGVEKMLVQTFATKRKHRKELFFHQ